MDAFKLLTRSTKFAKSGSQAPGAHSGRIPSAGQTASPQLFGSLDNGSTPQSQHFEEPQSRKRKRETPASNQTAALPLDIDYFNKSTEVGERQASKHVIAPDQRSSPQSSTHGKSAADHTVIERSGQKDLSEADCRRILKQHKIRVTCLATSADEDAQASADNDGSRGSKKLRREKSASSSARQKKNLEEIFPQPLLSFEQLRETYGVSRRLVENVLGQGYITPTEVQMGSLPLLLRKRYYTKGDNESAEKLSGDKSRSSGLDLLAIAPTGSGKTLAFLIPVLEGILRDKHQRFNSSPKETKTDVDAAGPNAVVVVPTKELLGQIVNEGRKLALGTGVKITGIRKGMRLVNHACPANHGNGHSSSTPDNFENNAEMSADEEQGSNGNFVKADVLVTTPLAFLNAIKVRDNGGSFPVPSVKHLVLDEADVLLDPLFRDQTLNIWNACSSPSLRVSLWSATMGSSIETLAQATIQSRRESLGLRNNPSEVWQLVRLVIGMKDSAVPNISHRLIYAATEAGKLLALRQLLHSSKVVSGSSPPLRPPFLVFTQTIPRAIALRSELLYDIPPEAGGSDRIAVLHSDLSDTVRDRVMTGFRKGEIWILITTDILSRGVDFRGVNGVVNYDVPNSAAAYIHRGGRTGRAGRDGGVAVTLYTKEDIPYVKNVANVIATTEKLRGKSGDDETGLQKWLLDVLPKPSKAAKKKLKRHGIEARNTPSSTSLTDAGGGSGQDATITNKDRARMRISTKSGYDRRLEHNRKGAIFGSTRRRKGVALTSVGEMKDGERDSDGGDGGGHEVSAGGDSEWEGIQD